jgi:hypothetical protein
LNDIGRNFLAGSRKKIAKGLMRTFTFKGLGFKIHETAMNFVNKILPKKSGKILIFYFLERSFVFVFQTVSSSFCGRGTTSSASFTCTTIPPCSSSGG